MGASVRFECARCGCPGCGPDVLEEACRHLTYRQGCLVTYDCWSTCILCGRSWNLTRGWGALRDAILERYRARRASFKSPWSATERALEA